MYKKIFFFIFFFIITTYSQVFCTQYYYKTNFISKKEKLQNGPVIEKIKRYTTHKNYILFLEADSIYFEKQKIGFLKTSLIKKLKAENIFIELKKNEKTSISFKASQAYFSLDGKKIAIKSPEIIYPENIKNPEKIVITLNKTIALVYKGNVDHYSF